LHTHSCLPPTPPQPTTGRYKNVIDEAARIDGLNGRACELAIETSGHAAFRSNGWLDDGAHLACLVVAEVKRGGIEGLLEGLEEPAESQEVRLNAGGMEETRGAMRRAERRIRDAVESRGAWTVEPVNHEGVRVAVDEGGGRKGWFLVRESLHEPLVAVMVESDVAGGGGEIARDLLELVFAGEARDLDLGPLEDLAKVNA